MASRYIKEIVEYDPEGPYYLSGFCYGGVLAFKIGVMMKEAGHDVRMLVMMDSATKSKTKKKALRKHHIVKQIIARFRDTLMQLEPLEGEKKFSLILYKMKRFIPLIDSFVMARVYWFAAKRNNKLLLKVARGHGALGYSYNLYKPEHYNGKVHYVKALQRSKPNQNQEYWKQFCDDYELFIMDCRHNEIIKGEHSKTFVQYLMKVMGEADA
jgi:thioesterase domain-containing protein